MFGLLAVIPALLFVVGLIRDRRKVGNAVWLGLTLMFLLLWAVSSARGWAADVVGVGVVVVLLLLALALPVALVVNGLFMVLREGRRLGNLLSLVTGFGILGLDVIFLIAAADEVGWIAVTSGALVVVAGYVGFLFGSLLLYAFIYGRTGKRSGFDAVIVLGSGLIGDRVPPLLASRLDRGAEIFRRSADRAPRLVVSGGQGRDELVSEAAAMRDYLVAKTIPPHAILLEDAATTTEENLRLSLALLDPPMDRVAAVTNNFHVFRTAMVARSLRLPVDVIGSPTAFYFLPSAFLREFVAIMTRHWIAHAVACGLLVTAYLLLVLG
jgi:uncharacterized SAM-binding protein YcdF (DUF218 family)